MTNAILQGKPDAGNPHVRFEEGEVASVKPRRGSLLHKKQLTTKVLAMALFVAPFAVTAKTTTWIGGDTGYFSAPENWSDGKPQSGDEVIFTKAVTLQQESFDLGNDGLVINASADLKNGVTFTGEGGIVKRGNGKLYHMDNVGGTFRGGVRIEAGALYLMNTLNQYYFGSGTITLVCTGTTKPWIRSDAYGCSLTNDIVIVGENMVDWQGAFTGQAATFTGNITSDSDFMIFKQSYYMDFNGKIVAPGHSVNVYTSRTEFNNNVTLNGEIQASILKTGAGPMTVGGVSPKIDQTMTLQGGVSTMTAAARWNGNVAVTGSGTKLKLMGSKNLAAISKIAISDGGMLDIAAGVSITVSELKVGDLVQPEGTYYSNDLPDTISGEGCIVVCGGASLWIGGSSGLISEGSNWHDGMVPPSGRTLIFTNAVDLLAETFDLGTDGYTIDSDYAIKSYVTFTGEGGIVKKGNGILYHPDDVGGTFCGGVRMEGGALYLMNTKNCWYFGSGPITLVCTGTAKPWIRADAYGCVLTNDIIILGENLKESQGAFTGQAATFTGTVTADSDFMIFKQSYLMDFNGKINAFGHTVKVHTTRTDFNNNVTLNGEVNASILKIGAGPMTIGGKSPNADQTMELQGGVSTMTEVAQWNGDVSVTGDGTALNLRSGENLSSNAVVRVTGGGQVGIADGVVVRVGELWVNGKQQNPGKYSAANLPDVITGNGALKVGKPGLVLILR